MAYAVCGSCGKEVYWHATRGQRLSDRHCPCGGELKGKTLGKVGPSKGKKIQMCVVCERRGFHLRQMAVDLTVGKLGRSWLDGQMIGDPITLQVGDWVHFEHLVGEVPYEHSVAEAIGYSAAAEQRRSKVEAFFMKVEVRTTK